MTAPRLFCGFDSLQHDQGGIARVGRLIMKVATDRVDQEKSVGQVVTLNPYLGENEFRVPVRSCGNSQMRFSWEVSKAKWSHTHFLYGFLGLARAHRLLPIPRRPFLGLAHGVEVWPGKWARKDRIEMARRAATLVTISNHTKRMATTLDETFERAITCSLATEEDELPPPATTWAPPRVLIVGRIDEGYKGHRELIECWPQIVAAIPEATLTIAGRGSMLEDYRTLARQSSVASRIEFLGFVPESDMPALWQRTAVFAMPSRGEGFGLVYIEAMRYGIPVIASIHDSGGEVNADGETGYNVDIDRPDELPERIIELLKNRDKASVMGAAGQRRWMKHFRYSAFRDRFAPILHDFLQK